MARERRFEVEVEVEVWESKPKGEPRRAVGRG